MPDYDAQEGSALRRLLVCLGAIALFITLIVIGLSATGTAHLLPMQARAASSPAANWDFARPARIPHT